MATLYITEFVGQGRDGNNALAPVAPLPALNDQIVAIGASSVASNPLSDQTGLVRLIADAACSISVALASGAGLSTPAAPVATTSNLRLAPNVPEFFTIPCGQKAAIAVIANV